VVYYVFPPTATENPYYCGAPQLLHAQKSGPTDIKHEENMHMGKLDRDEEDKKKWQPECKALQTTERGSDREEKKM